MQQAPGGSRRLAISEILPAAVSAPGFLEQAFYHLLTANSNEAPWPAAIEENRKHLFATLAARR
jgi:hypothetical protein